MVLAKKAYPEELFSVKEVNWTKCLPANSTNSESSLLNKISFSYKPMFTKPLPIPTRRRKDSSFLCF